MRPSARAVSVRDEATSTRLPPVAGYMVAWCFIAVAIFFAAWWLLQENGDEAPWVPAGFAAAIVLMIAAAAREVFVRRAWTRHILEQDKRPPVAAYTKKHKGSGTRTERFTSALRALQHQSSQVNATTGTPPEAHLELYHSCQEFLAGADEKFGSSNARGASVNHHSEWRAVLRAGQERAHTLARQHLLAWARGASRVLTHEAQRRTRLADKIETAIRASDVIDAALKIYPDEPELQSSAVAVQELVTTIKVAHWVEVAERAAFRGQLARAIDRYHDALFYLSRGTLREDRRVEIAEQIGRAVEILRTRRRTSSADIKPAAHSGARENV